MKKIVFFIAQIALLSLFASCSTDEPLMYQPDESSIAASDTVNEAEFVIDQETALDNAIAHLELADKKNAKVKRKMLSCKRVRGRRGAPSQQAPDSYYLFNFADGNGFAVVSADKRDSVDVFVASPEGNIPAEAWSDTGELSYLKSLVDNYHAGMVAKYAASPKKTVRKQVRRRDPYHNWEGVKTTTVTCSVGPLLLTRWTQDFPFNYNTQPYLLGCGPVAIGQIMAYHQSPLSVSVGGQNYSFDWDSIATIHTVLDALNNIPNLNKVSSLLASIGAQANAQYGQTVTTIATNVVCDVFNHYGYSCSQYIGYSLPLLKSELLNNRPILMRGNASDNNIGHMWVIDGILETHHCEGYVDRDGNPIQNTILEEYYYEEDRTYVYMNMGRGLDSHQELASIEHISYLYNIPLQVFSGIFVDYGISYDQNLMMWYNIQPSNI